jgi:hypothetical protein
MREERPQISASLDSLGCMFSKLRTPHGEVQQSKKQSNPKVPQAISDANEMTGRKWKLGKLSLQEK